MTQGHCLALVTDAFGGRGGIAQYNRDFLSALAECGVMVDVVPRHAPDPV
jgi:phosphatidylinositol alpha-1,6-mannosyltransferase